MDATNNFERSSGDGFLLVIDEFGKIIYVSESVLSHLGFSYLDVTGQSWFSLIHPDDQVFSRTHLKEAIAKCTPQHALPSNQKFTTITVQSVTNKVTDIPELAINPDGSKIDANSIPAIARPGRNRSPVRGLCSAITVRILKGYRHHPAKDIIAMNQTQTTPQPESQTVRPLSVEPGSDAIRRVPGNLIDLEHANDFIDGPSQLVYRYFHFSGITKSFRNNPEQSHRPNIVWIAVGRPAESEEVLHREPIGSVPTHFVVRHDESGLITSVDDRCRYFIGYSPEKLVHTCLFDYLSAEDVPYLLYQYNQLVSFKCESIAVIYRFRMRNGNDNEAPLDQQTTSIKEIEGHQERRFMYLNCRAYMALNPRTFHLDQIVTLATTMSEAEGEAELTKQLARLGPLMQREPSEATAANYVKQLVLGMKKSPIHSPDSNTHDRDSGTGMTPASVDKISGCSPEEWRSQEGLLGSHGPASRSVSCSPEDMVGINVIDSQCSPSKYSEVEGHAVLNGTLTTTPSPPARSLSRTGESTSPARNESVTSKRDRNSGRNSSASVEEVRRKSAGLDVHDDHGALQNQSPLDVHAVVLSPRSKAQVSTPAIKSPTGSHASTDISLAISNVPSDGENKENPVVRSLFHEQLRDKHRFLERSIANQQYQLQELQHRLLALVNEGANSVMPTPQNNMQMQLQMQLQGPLHKVMELQARLHLHKENTRIQRARIDEDQEQFHSQPHAHRNSLAIIPENGVVRNKDSSVQLPRSISFPGGIPTEPNRHQHAPSSVVNSPLPQNLDQLGMFHLEDERFLTMGALSPPFVDMTGSGKQNGELTNDGRNSINFHGETGQAAAGVGGEEPNSRDATGQNNNSQGQNGSLSSKSAEGESYLTSQLFNLNATGLNNGSSGSQGQSQAELEFEQGLMDLENLLKFDFDYRFDPSNPLPNQSLSTD